MNMGNIVQDGLMLVISEFIIFLLYIVLSDPVVQVISSICTAGLTMGVTQMTFYQNLVFSVLTICFIILGFIPVIWFIVRTMSREPDWGYRYGP